LPEQWMRSGVTPAWHGRDRGLRRSRGL